MKVQQLASTTISSSRLPPMNPTRTYLGDSVYAEMENGMIRLSLFNGIQERDVIYLEPEVYAALVTWQRSLHGKAANE